MVVSSVLQAARRYDFLPRYELAIVVLRFAVLWAGLSARINFFWVVVAQLAVQIVLALGPALWVMARELGHVPHFAGARRADYRALLHISFYMFLIQLSVVLADKVDTTILGFALPDPGWANAVYAVVSKPFSQVRQMGWMLASMVMPTLVSNWLVPGAYLFRVLEIRGRTYLVRTLAAPLAGAAALVAATWLLRRESPIVLHGETVLVRSIPLLVHLGVGCLAFAA